MVQAKTNATELTTGEVFADGTILDLVRAHDAEDLNLLRWDGHTETVSPSFDRDGKIYRTPPLDPFSKGMFLPASSQPYGSTSKLFGEVEKILQTFLDLPPTSLTLLTSFVFYTWVADNFQQAATLCVLRSASGSTPVLFRLLRCLCRRALLLGGLTPASLCEMPMVWKPTLLITGHQHSESMGMLLSASSCRDVFVPRSRALLDLFCPKVIFFDDPPDWEVVPAVYILSPAARSQRVLDDKQAEEIATRFQPKFLHYRLRSFCKVRDSRFDVSDFKSPNRELASYLAASTIDAPGLQTNIVDSLAEQDESLRLELSTDPRAIVLEALLVLCHEHKAAAYVHEIAELANGILDGRHEILSLKPREVGTFLKALGLPTRRLGKAGRGLQLLEGQRKRIHQLAEQFDVRSTGAADCSLCESRKSGPRATAPDARAARDA